jgi:hypothetical protein
MSLMLLFCLQKQEETMLNEGMMSKKTKRLYDRMQHGISKKREFVENLEDKRRVMEEQQSEEVGKKRGAEPAQTPVRGGRGKKAKK